MRRLVVILLLLCVPVFASAETDPAAAAEGHGESHDELYFGFIPGWILKTLNVIVFFGLLGYLISGPVKRALASRKAAIQAAAEEARNRRARADQMAGEIQARLTQIESEVRGIRERAQAEGERQRRELVAAAEAEAAKILQAARNEVDNRLKSAREELTQFAGELATERAEAILREKMTDADRTKLFQESLKEIEGARP